MRSIQPEDICIQATLNQTTLRLFLYMALMMPSRRYNQRTDADKKTEHARMHLLCWVMIAFLV